MEEKHPLVSVIMPVYNAEKTVERAIRSVQSQTCPDWELLAVDDGSADGSGAVCDRCAQEDARIRVFHTPNAGVSHARNTAMQAARGEWIAFLDSDDSYDPAFLQTMLANAADVDMVICMYQILPKGETVAADACIIQKAEFESKQALAVFLQNKAEFLTFYVWNKLIRRTVIQYDFQSKFSYGEDTLFVLENLPSIRRVRVVPDCLYHYTYLSQISLSKKLHLNANEFRRKKFELMEKLLASEPQALQVAAQNYCMEVCSYFLKLISIKGKSRQDKLLVMQLQINEVLFRPVAPYGAQGRGIFRLLWRALQTQKAEWVYFVFSVLGKPYMRYQALKEKMLWRDGRK